MIVCFVLLLVQLTVFLKIASFYKWANLVFFLDISGLSSKEGNCSPFRFILCPFSSIIAIDSLSMILSKTI